MNYRHAFHAGNHTEVFKHTALALLLRRLVAKPKPFMVLDTHAGAGLYDLSSPEALRTGEAAEGVLRLDLARLEAASAYAEAVRPYLAQRRYPGSPTIIADTLRAGDRLTACELWEDDAARLRRLFASDERVSTHHRDGYEAMLALIPPPERRGLVFVDPPFEKTDEASRLARTLVAGAKKWPTGIFAAWYPIKGREIAAEIARELARSGLPNVLRAEFLRKRMDGSTLAGGGMVFVNPPWRYQDELRAAADELLPQLADTSGRFDTEWLAPPL